MFWNLLENGRDVLQEAGWGERAKRVLRAGLNIPATLASRSFCPKDLSGCDQLSRFGADGLPCGCMSQMGARKVFDLPRVQLFLVIGGE